jgi:hypothetical protein
MVATLGEPAERFGEVRSHRRLLGDHEFLGPIRLLTADLHGGECSGARCLTKCDDSGVVFFQK